VAPFTFCDGTCANCAVGWTGNCLNGGSFGNHGVDGGQGEYVRVPYADATLVKVPAAYIAALPPLSSSATLHGDASAAGHPARADVRSS
jgi:threonine dehydrogenase-like Zn-dependent dehydrogenase